MQQRRDGDAERSAHITMTDFHPWSLGSDDHTNYVPCVCKLRHFDSSWEETMCEWLNGNIICDGAARYVGNFLSVYRMRPRDLADKARSDEDVDDEELILTHDDVEGLDLQRLEVDNPNNK